MKRVFQHFAPIVHCYYVFECREPRESPAAEIDELSKIGKLIWLYYVLSNFFFCTSSVQARHTLSFQMWRTVEKKKKTVRVRFSPHCYFFFAYISRWYMDLTAVRDTVSLCKLQRIDVSANHIDVYHHVVMLIFASKNDHAIRFCRIISAYLCYFSNSDAFFSIVRIFLECFFLCLFFVCSSARLFEYSKIGEKKNNTKYEWIKSAIFSIYACCCFFFLVGLLHCNANGMLCYDFVNLANERWKNEHSWFCESIDGAQIDCLMLLIRESLYDLPEEICIPWYDDFFF